MYSYKIVNRFPQDIEAFTQGLKFEDGYIYLGTGKRGYSSLTQARLADGYIKKKVELENQYFGEGIEIVGNQIFQLTWQENKVFVFDKSTFEIITSFSEREIIFKDSRSSSLILIFMSVLKVTFLV